MAVNCIGNHSGSSSNMEIVNVHNLEVNSDDEDFEGLHYRKFIRLLRRWNNTDPVSLEDIKFFMQLNNIFDGKMKILSLLHKGLKKNEILRREEFWKITYVLVNKKI